MNRALASQPQPSKYRRADFNKSPFVVFYELTQACDLACAHCRASAQPNRHPLELSTDQAKQLIDQLASFALPPLLVLTGGDPLKRPDLYELVAHGVSRKLEVALTPSATPLLTAEAIGRLREAGLARLAVSLDGGDAATHDAFRGRPGSFARTLEVIGYARSLGLPVQVNTTLCKRNVHQLDDMARMLASQSIVLWSVFFLVPVGRGKLEPRLEPDEYEQVFERLWHHAQCQPYAIKTTEGHHYRRFVLQRRGNPQRSHVDSAAGPVQRAPLGVNDGNGVMFISHVGVMYPSGFLALPCGRFPDDSVVDVYQRHALFRLLRDPDKLGGKCGVCEYRHVCGGSRARAFAVTGDPLAQEPDCSYQPPAWRH